jgi:YihY family inner membrane protein
MSTATFVPETRALSGIDAKDVLRRTGRGRLLKDSIKRYSAADGSSHSRAVAHAGILTFFPGLIAVVGLAATFHLTTFQNILERTVAQLAPGPSGQILTEALHQGSKTASNAALIAGLAASLVSGTIAMAQIQRGANRVYGIQRDRPGLRRYLVAFLLDLTAGIMLVGAFVLLAAGGALADAVRSSGWTSPAASAFSIARWPAGILLAVAAIMLIFKVAPHRHQPKFSWLVGGTVVAAVLWLVFTGLLALYFVLDKQLGQTYGPLLGIIGLLLWAYLTSIALYLGLAFAAQLESVRAGTPSTESKPDVRITLPEAEPVPAAAPVTGNNPRPTV